MKEFSKTIQNLLIEENLKRSKIIEQSKDYDAIFNKWNEKFSSKDKKFYSESFKELMEKDKRVKNVILIKMSELWTKDLSFLKEWVQFLKDKQYSLGLDDWNMALEFRRNFQDLSKFSDDDMEIYPTKIVEFYDFLKYIRQKE